MKRAEQHSPSPDHSLEGSAIIAVLSVLALLSLLLVSLLHSVRLERSSSTACAEETRSRLAAESGTSAAFALLMTTTSDRPAFLVGLAGEEEDPGTAPALVIGATNLTTETQLAPLLSCDPEPLSSYPRLPRDFLGGVLQKRLSTNTAETVDLNDPSLVLNPSDLRGHPEAGAAPRGGIIAPTGRYPALWQTIRDSGKKAVARYAFILLDESARLNPGLHRGEARTDPVDWQKGPGDLPLTNGSPSLATPEEAARLVRIASNLPTLGSLEAAFDDPAGYEAKKPLFTRDPCLLPDLIPAGLPEGGLPKYNLNDLATNPAWGSTPYERAGIIASIIDRNIPKFKERDPSLSGRGADPSLYLRRLACSIVDYISPEPGPTGPPGGEPSGRDLTPYVTQIAECCTRTTISSNSVTIESRFFAELWNPYTTPIQAGGLPRLIVGNRARVSFGTGVNSAFSDYDGSAPPLPTIRPNEFTVVAFDPVVQIWTSPEATSLPPRWTNGPAGNADTLSQQSFQLYWNGRRVDMSRPAGISPGDVAGGLAHLGQTLQDDSPHWQCMTIPTWSSTSDDRDTQDESEEAVQPGSYRFVGDPRATFLTSYKWSVATNYPSKTLWKGISPAGTLGRGYVLDPMNTWTRRDRVPVNPFRGTPPGSDRQTPERIPSPYKSDGAGSEPPAVIRKGPMLSIGELGHIFDPAQVDDLGQAPLAGSPKKTRFCSGGGRTLRVGQPEFHVADPSADWDLPGKRAVELIDLFTVAGPGREPGTNTLTTNSGIAGRINVNTAPHAVLTALFSGIGVTSDRRFTNCTIGARAAGSLATLIEENRPYDRLSDLHRITARLTDAETYTPPLSRNVPGLSPPVADVFDRAREEAFGKVIGHCAVQSRSFRIVVLGEALDRAGKPSGRSLMEGTIRLAPDESGRLLPSLHDVQWH